MASQPLEDKVRTTLFIGDTMEHPLAAKEVLTNSIVVLSKVLKLVDWLYQK